ncbi:carbohydrate ABC transporter permease [Cohnella silvisoli]|uniref:Carbohydrate ABC transporter permease n=1 Tax=Cohnella silvisoli TaxID=2873699 RepID=A0ABV1L5B4_9BACL|nr:carbohydrate ABC transporter permease [Cohnella silvisoli]MCD9026180.1 carbohydrate ABC transporter permease [Cohnella silvisoli]
MKAAEIYRNTAAHVNRFIWSRRMQRVKMAALGQHTNDGWIARIMIYFLLSVLAYLYLQPLFYIVSTMFKNLNDLLDPTVKWIPRTIDLENLRTAWLGLNYPEAFMNTITIALACSVIQVFICAMTGYALAKLPFPGKGIVTFLIMLTFLVPPQIIIIPLYVVYSKLGLLNTPLVFIIPAFLGQGIRSALFIIIFRQFFKTQPATLEEAAKLDGASSGRLFFKIMLPLARSACLVVFLFSFIWYWNMYYEPSMFLQNDYLPLSISLNRLDEVLTGLPKGYVDAVLGSNPVSEAPKMAAAFLIIFPPLLVYVFLQRWFVEGIERTGLVE